MDEVKVKPASTPAGKSEERPARRALAVGPIVQTLVVPILAVFTALIIGALVIVFTEPVVLAAYRNFFSAPGEALRVSWEAVSKAYGALLQGSLGSPYAISESLVASVPYIFAGLGVAFGFRGGLFNIGAEGQLFIGALTSVFVGYAVTGLPLIIHLPLALLAGAAGGAFWAAIPGYLKAKTGAHEVVVTIMMNYVAFRFSDWMLNGPMKRLDPKTGQPGFVPISPEILPSAYLPRFFPDPIRFHAGFFLALAVAVAVWWLLFKTTVGFEIRAAGANRFAARYAGVNLTFMVVFTMAISGALCGLAGTNQVLGVDHWLGQGFSSGYGFDSIALALLGKSHPLGVVLASLLFGTLRSGATRMQSLADIPIDIISIIQALIIIFIAAPEVIRWLYRVRVQREELVSVSGWGK